eukprot:CAMPEP_0170064894 /NCGR_PEP_ID=MMETSP0019_2-20121128/5192_1 /TAXON_ID=98059 /ORGANISM="Dinobryon sp., Strain UTEXLB2267" /LENGTH=84 /DNA_ID=CAMNT_0010271641 /DNA_START=680 /DNA_END=934 /DNA_ORIENTATION=-
MVIVPTGIINDWPYDFMRLDSSDCFIWYNVLLIVSTLFYGILVLLQLIKERILNRFGVKIYDYDNDEVNLLRSSESVTIIERAP